MISAETDQPTAGRIPTLIEVFFVKRQHMHDAELMLGCVRWLLWSQNIPWRSGDGSAKRRSIRRRCVGIKSFERTIQGYCDSDSQQQLKVRQRDACQRDTADSAAF
jgi:hypothetical protein